MRRGSNLLLLMMLVYIVIAAIALLLFGGRQFTEKTGEEKASLGGRITGDVSDGISEETKQRLEDTGDTPYVEEPSVEEAEEPEIPEEHYYRFRASHSSQGLRVREEPSLQAKILGRIDPGHEGYVLERGDTWSKIISEDGRHTGFCFNEYLAFTEITKEEYDEGLLLAGYTEGEDRGDTLLVLGETVGTGQGSSNAALVTLPEAAGTENEVTVGGSAENADR
ncbi:MAG: SH3 domain-containing protein [Lachnospiraceae bacterium]|nr:SH3 domain-containing protein [Lachnospiraceae bacterium]